MPNRTTVGSQRGDGDTDQPDDFRRGAACSGGHRAVRSRRGWALWGLLIVPALAVGGVFVVRGSEHPAARNQSPAAAAWPARACEPATAAALVCARPSRTASATPARHVIRHMRRAKRTAPRPAHTAQVPVSQPSSPPPNQAPSLTSAAQQVLALINQARAQAGLPAYTPTAGLDRSAAAHTAMMAGGCGLSHQCPGEPPLGARETAAGVQWTAAGENIGEGGPVPATAAVIAQMAVTLTQDMLNERPPDDGHRLNILSATFHHIGIAVYRDASGTVWMTQDFSN